VSILNIRQWCFYNSFNFMLQKGILTAWKMENYGIRDFVINLISSYYKVELFNIVIIFFFIGVSVTFNGLGVFFLKHVFINKVSQLMVYAHLIVAYTNPKSRWFSYVIHSVWTIISQLLTCCILPFLYIMENRW